MHIVYHRLKWLTACVALALLLAANTGAAQAQTPGADLVGVYRSEALDNELTEQTLVWQLTLLPDGGAEAMIVFVTTDSVSFEAGSWSVDDAGDVIVTMERRFEPAGGRERPVEPPFDIHFTVDGDTLTAADFLMYGPRDLVLTRTDDEPISFLNDEGGLHDDLKTGLAEWPDALYVGAYRTDDFSVRGATRWFALDLRTDGSARIDFPPEADSDAVTIRASWYNNGDGTISVTQIADLDSAGKVVHTYRPPLLFAEMDRMESGTLYARTLLLPDGSQPLFFQVKAAESAAGLYGGGLVADDVPKIGVILELRDDGSLEVVVTPLDGKSLPMAALGVWEQAGVTVTLTLSSEIAIVDGKPVVRATEPRVPELLVLDEGKLVGPAITFVPLPLHNDSADATQPADPSSDSPPRPLSEPEAPSAKTAPVAAEDVTYMVAREQLVAGMTVVLALNADGSASMSTQLGSDAGTLLELGSWEEDAEAVVVTLDRSAYDNVAYADANVLTFKRTDERTLTGLDYDTERYGEELVLYDTRDY